MQPNFKKIFETSTIGKSVTFSQTISACILNHTFIATVNNAFIYDEGGARRFATF